MLTLFTAPKPFRGHIGLIQANAIRSWMALAPDIEVLLVGDEPGLAEAARRSASATWPGSTTPKAARLLFCRSSAKPDGRRAIRCCAT